MNHTTGSKSFFLEIRQNSTRKTLGFTEIGVSQTCGFVGISLADMLNRQTHRQFAVIMESFNTVHDFMHMQCIVFNIGSDTPHSPSLQCAMNLTGKLRLHDATLVMTHLGPWIGEEGPHFSDRAICGDFEEFRSVDLCDAQIGKALLARKQHGVSHTRIVDFKRQKIHFWVFGGRGNNVFALTGTDFHNQRIGIAPRFRNIRLVEHQIVSHVKGAFTCIDIQKISIGIGIPCALQARVEPGGTAHERKHLAPIQGGTLTSISLLFTLRF